MNPQKAPLPILLIGWLFVAVGGGGIVRSLLRSDLFAGGSLKSDDLWAVVSGIVALAGGILVIRAMGLGRWLILAWLVFHVVLSALHPSIEKLIVHALFLLLFGYFLFRPQASTFFHRP